eukprot:1152525-Amphidinium_carterae.1
MCSALFLYDFAMCGSITCAFFDCWLVSSAIAGLFDNLTRCLLQHALVQYRDWSRSKSQGGHEISLDEWFQEFAEGCIDLLIRWADEPDFQHEIKLFVSWRCIESAAMADILASGSEQENERYMDWTREEKVKLRLLLESKP